jgi:cysteine desulfurase
LIYLDHAATTMTDPRVVEEMMPYLTYEFGNPGSLHEFGRSARDAVDKAREQVACFFHCEPEQVLFTSGATEANNTVFQGICAWLRSNRKGNLVVSQIEHDSVWKSAHRLETMGYELRVCPPNNDGQITQSAVRALTDAFTGIVSVMLANNETGVINDAINIGDFCHDNGILYHCDAVQAAGLDDLDTENIFSSVDFMTISGHKIGGPKGIGALFVRNPELLSPLIVGGSEQEFGFRGGTENVPAIVGFGKACELAQHEQEKHFEYLSIQHRMLYFLLLSLAKEQGLEIRVNGDPERATPKTLNVCFPGIDAQTLLLLLDNNQICVSAGSACRAHENIPSRVLTSMGISEEDARSSIRISLSHTNTPEEIDRAAHAIICLAASLKTFPWQT